MKEFEKKFVVDFNQYTAQLGRLNQPTLNLRSITTILKKLLRFKKKFKILLTFKKFFFFFFSFFFFSNKKKYFFLIILQENIKGKQKSHYHIKGKHIIY
jgi:hypothetical protein